jgi:hypothetical protein
MLYFHLLLARLDARAELGRASFEPHSLETTVRARKS